MPKISLAGFKDPVRRPRYIIWTGVAVLVLAAVMIVALGVTSTRWFCAEGCHKVQDDTIIAYEHSSHSEISCMACHMPVHANPVVFILHKAEALGELYLTVTDNFELPLNGESEVSLTMATKQCTQCHNLDNRAVTPTPGIKIDHKVHGEINAACPVCHNRIAHREDFELTLKDPETGEPNKKHADFMKMTACFRCHGLEKGAAAPGTCSACHTPEFQLKPPSHQEKEFFPKGHAELAMEEVERIAEFEAEEAQGEGGAEGEATEGEATEGEGGASEEASPAKEASPAEGQSLLGPDKAYASGGGTGAGPVPKEEVPEVIAAQRSHGADDEASIGEELPKVQSINYCYTCHTEQFCSNCHGMAMPHPAEFKEPKDAKDPNGHPAVSKAKPAKCEMCHGKNEQTHFCDSCHHGSAIKYEYNAKTPWQTQHPKAVAQSGVKACTENCHVAKFCVDCHTGKKVVPSSHSQANWTKPKPPGALTVYGKTPAKPSAKHSLEAQKSVESCEVCHGAGGINAAFCKSCHKLAMPHPAEFKKNHVSSKKNVTPCRNCHLWPELCSNCHHVGSSTSKTWISLHGASVNTNGPEGCVEACHKKQDCVKCHTSRKVVPASHKKSTFVRDYSAKKAQHVQLYTTDGEVCTYCHAGEAAALPNSKYCTNCHKLAMPHKVDSASPQKFPHAKDAGGMIKGLNKAQCANCHKPTFCDSCHHKGSSASKPWLRDHPRVVKDGGADPCFECHEPTFCANCHVNLAKRGLL